MPVRSRTAPRGLAVALALLALGTAACGNGGMAVDQGGGAETTATARPENTAKPKGTATPANVDEATLKAAESAFRAFVEAPSLTVKMDMTGEVRRTSVVAQVGRGKECLIRITAAPDLTTVVMRTGDNAHYTQMNEARVRSVSGVSPEQRQFDVELLGDRWMKSPARPTRTVRQATRICELTSEMRKGISGKSSAGTDDESFTQRTITENGRRLLVLSSPDEDKTFEIFMTTGPKPSVHRLRVVVEDGRKAMTLTQSEELVRVYHPAPEDVLTVAELEAAYKNAPDRSLRNRV